MEDLNSAKPSLARIFARKALAKRNRGQLLDIVVFILNLLLMRRLSGYVLEIIHAASTGEPLARLALALAGVGMSPACIRRPFFTILQTVLIYRYFPPPKRPPRFQFLTGPESESIGDICIFVSMILFRLFGTYCRSRDWVVRLDQRNLLAGCSF